MRKITLLLCALSALITLQAEVRLPAILGDGMVIQRNTDINIWGWAEPNKKIKVTASWSKDKFTTTSDSEGNWLVEIPTGEAMWDQSITIDDGDKLTLNEVMIGDVWICSGQSNMERALQGDNSEPTYETLNALIEAKRYPNLRLFTVENTSAHEPADDCPNVRTWSDASADNIYNFSAVAYFFGRTLSSFIDDVPIGLIHNSWGGTRIEAWMSEQAYDNLPTEVDREPLMKKSRNQKGTNKLYNGMIHPLINHKAKGFLWYQGEANRFNYSCYHTMMAAMVKSWREDWGDDTMPFYFVQIAPFAYSGDSETILPLLVESQVKALDIIPYSGMAATTDLGNPATIHPPKKREVGERLAYLALRNDYGVKSTPMPAPTYKDMSIKTDTVTVTFNNVSRGTNGNNSLVFNSDSAKLDIKGFEVAGADKQFHPAKAWINRGNNTISVKSSEVTEPVAVRYAFYNVSDGNVVTCFGQPLIPFRSDDWE